MSAKEVYTRIAKNMIEAVMLHDELACFYDFLGLPGYKRLHEYHAMAEFAEYRSVSRYYINHHNSLIPYSDTDYDHVIPSRWYDYTRQDVDESTKKSAVKTGMRRWVDWERSSKKLYEKLYNDLLELGEVASANKVHELICHVDAELKRAERCILNLEVLDYDLVWIISEQDHLHRKYDKKTREKLKVKIC